MQKPTMTIEQQRDYIRRLQEGWEAASEDQIERARKRTEQQSWIVANRLLMDWPHVRKRRTNTSGLVEQQNFFKKLHAQ
jgi:hypothetical protein